MAIESNAVTDEINDEDEISIVTPEQAHYTIDPDENTIHCQGEWTVQACDQLMLRQPTIPWPRKETLCIDGQNIKHFDTAGAWLLCKIINDIKRKVTNVTLVNFSQQQQDLLELIQSKSAIVEQPITIPKKPWLHRLGQIATEKISEAMRLLSFIGELTIVTIRSIRDVNALQLKLMLNTIELTGFRALGIVGLLSALIGVVLAYQMGLQLRNYGANIYIVDLLGISILREFGPLITAIIVAGRTGSSFTAEIGTMKITEEIDAMRTMGLTPSELLVLPKVLGLMIALPLLALWSDIFGVLGGMIMSKSMLHINYTDFLLRFRQNIEIKHLIIGLSKAPVFALLIAVVGCFQGFLVTGSADSVGKQTTKSVVLAIFLIIVADAIFSVIFSWQGL